MRRFSDRHSMTTLSELNVTPLLDLCFVLLIIFMITTPLMENSVELVVPSSSTAKTQVNPAEVQMIEMGRNDTIKFNGDPTTLADLPGLLAAAKGKDPQVSVVVRPDRDLPIQKFIGVMDILKATGIAKVGVMTRPEESQGSN